MIENGSRFKTLKYTGENCENQADMHRVQVSKTHKCPAVTIERFRFEYDYEIRHFWRQLLASSRADVIKS